MTKPSSAPSDYLAIAKIGASYGLSGYLKLQSYCEPKAKIFDYSPWYLLKNKTYQIFQLDDAKISEEKFLIKPANCNTPESARLLTNQLIYIHQNQLPKLKDEYYWHDLIGCEVKNLRGEKLGMVEQMLETGANDVMLLKAKQHRAIPFIMHSVIQTVDIKNKLIIADWELDF